MKLFSLSYFFGLCIIIFWIDGGSKPFFKGLLTAMKNLPVLRYVIKFILSSFKKMEFVRIDKLKFASLIGLV